MHSLSSESGSFEFNKDIDHLPLPKGNSPYAQAKRAEYIDRDTLVAKMLYQKAIQLGDRTESALKDLASILHQ